MEWKRFEFQKIKPQIPLILPKNGRTDSLKCKNVAFFDHKTDCFPAHGAPP